MKAINLTKTEFEKKIASLENSSDNWNYLGSRPAVIDFYAEWCGPCKMLAPVLDDVAEEYKDKIDVYKVNVEDEEELAAKFGIRGVPSILFIPMKGIPRMTQGALPKKSLDEIINEILLNQ